MFLIEQFESLLQEAGPFEERAMVMGVLDKSFDLFILKFGVSKRVYTDVSFFKYTCTLELLLGFIFNT